MAASRNTSAEVLLGLFELPIRRISQLSIRCDEYESTSIPRSWGGIYPIFVFEFDDVKGSYLYVAASEYLLLMRTAQSIDDGTLTGFLNDITDHEIAAFSENEYSEIGLFDLDSVICPVPEWQDLRITRADITTMINGSVIGFSVHVNMGIRIGIFVSPYPGVTLAFNDSCDEVIRQAKSTENLGCVRVLSRDYPGNETPSQIETIDWFDWLRKSR